MRTVGLRETGNYLVQVSSSDLSSSGEEMTGSYWLRPESLVPPAPVDATLDCGGQASGTIDTPAAIDQITLPAQAGATDTLSLTSSGFAPYATLHAPDGSNVTTVIGTNRAVSFQLSGTCVVKVRSGDFGSTRSYTLSRARG